MRKKGKMSLKTQLLILKKITKEKEKRIKKSMRRKMKIVWATMLNMMMNIRNSSVLIQI